MTIEIQPQLPSQSSELLSIRGHQRPRFWTPPLRELTPETSYGFAVIEFAKLIGMPLDPWQEWLVIHMGELSEERDDKGNKVPLQRMVLIEIARQNGKTLLLEVLSLYWMFIERHPLIVGMNATLSDALKVMMEISEIANSNEYLAPLVRKTKQGNTDPSFQTIEGSTYKPVAATEKGGRGSRIQRLIIDELRLHKDRRAYNAAVPATSAQKNAQVVFITNAGSDTSVVLNTLREAALDHIKNGAGLAPPVALYEWSAPDGSDIYLPSTWAYANPSLGVRKTIVAMQLEAAKAKTGSTEEADFRTEHLCMHVRNMDSAIDAQKWAECLDTSVSFADTDKSKLHYCVDVSLNGKHATLAVAGFIGDRVHVEVVKHWSGIELNKLPEDLHYLAGKFGIQNLGYFPNGPIANYLTRIQALNIRGLKVQEIRGEAAQACEGFATDVLGKHISHSSDPQASEPAVKVLTDQVIATAKKHQGDRWIFTRKFDGNCDAVYAAAGAVLQARLAPEPTETFVVLPD